MSPFGFSTRLKSTAKILIVAHRKYHRKKSPSRDSLNRDLAEIKAISRRFLKRLWIENFNGKI
ncbi:MAG: hypothetical protein APZ16_04765 [Candidatus Hadarchaeum yellowstonense]|uniref:Uncharacterized protein n=1 Tax=Hadarchaeum yellowstonense TaxID=1776334 RepID=A0A147JTM0_HADYE|nr:MAG: hypothetical protein APZ16_04765 [Candidatus Hadarchaeum yellowstonense]